MLAAKDYIKFLTDNATSRAKQVVESQSSCISFSSLQMYIAIVFVVFNMLHAQSFNSSDINTAKFIRHSLNAAAIMAKCE